MPQNYNGFSTLVNHLTLSQINLFYQVLTAVYMPGQADTSQFPIIFLLNITVLHISSSHTKNYVGSGLFIYLFYCFGFFYTLCELTFQNLPRYFLLQVLHVKL